jgi:Mrp family chromosome partitioning ATPase
MTPATHTANGRDETLSDALEPGRTLNLEVSSAYSVGPLTSSKPRASLAALDAFRTLALTIDSLAGDSPIQTMALLSAVPGEGRSLSAELLSLAFSEFCSPVRLLDADPFQHAVKRREHRRARSKDPRQSTGMEGNDLLAPESPSTNGNGPAFQRIPVARDSYPGPSAFLQAVRGALDAAIARGARVLVDAPACSLSSIGFSIAQMVDAAIYVVRPDRASLDAHREVLTQLTLLNVNVLGTVLNEG